MEQFTFETLPQAVSQLYDKISNIERLLLQGTSPTLTDHLLTIKQAAELLSLSVPTIYGLVAKQDIPVSKRGKRLYFSQQELTDWVKSGRKLTNIEIDSRVNNFLPRKSI